MRVVLFTALSVRVPSIKMNVMHLLENGQNRSMSFLHECTPCLCLTTVGKRKVVVTLFHLPLQSEYAKLTLTLSRRQGLLPLTRARQSVRPPEIKGRPARSLGFKLLFGPQRWQQPFESRLAVAHRPLLQASASKKSSFMCRASHCVDSLSSSAEEPLGFFLHTHNVVFGSAPPCKLQQPGTWTCAVPIRFNETQKGKQPRSFCLQLRSVSALKTTVESSRAILIHSRGNQCHNGIVEADRPLKLCSRHKTVQICIDVLDLDLEGGCEAQNCSQMLFNIIC